MIKLKPITEDNFFSVVKMKLPEEKYVAPNVYSLAQAWLYNDIARPYAIYHDDELVGFIMLALEDDIHTISIWRLMIGSEHLGRGYGQEVIRLIINKVKTEFNYQYHHIKAEYHEENKIAEHIYQKYGFIPTGDNNNGFVSVVLDI